MTNETHDNDVAAATSKKVPAGVGLDIQDGKVVPRKQVFSWALWDWATQPFNSVILTFVFASLYLVSDSFLPKAIAGLPDGDPAKVTGLASLTSQYGAWTAIAGLLIFFLAPVLGSRSETTGGRKRWLIVFTGLLALAQFALFFVHADPAYFTIGAITLALGAVVSEIAGVNYNAMLHQVSTPSTRGRVSGLGWGMGYMGGILALVLVVVVTQLDWFGLDTSDGLAYRLIAVGSGIWTIVFAIPLLINVPEKRIIGAPKVGFLRSYVELVKDMIALFHQSRSAFWFLFASAVYRDGLAGVFAFGGILAAVAFGFSSNEVLFFGIAANLIAGLSTIFVGRLDDRFGSKAVIVTALGLLIAMALFIFFGAGGGKIVFWIGGLILSASVGPAQAASRALLTRVTPEAMQGDVFGLYATTGRVASILSPALWTIFIVAFGSTVFGIIGIAIVLVLGLVLLLLVKLPRTMTVGERFHHLTGWNDKAVSALTLILFLGVGSVFFGLTGAAHIPGGPAIAAVGALIAAFAIVPAWRAIGEITTSHEGGVQIARATVLLGAVAILAAIVFVLMQFGILPTVSIGG
jgi:UMF1 family MFS transporter